MLTSAIAAAREAHEAGRAEARAATVQEIAAALMSDEAGAAYFTALGRDGRWDHHTMRPLAAAWEIVARRFASPTGTDA